MKLEFFRQIFQIYSNVKFNENPSSWVQVVPHRWVEGQTDILKLMMAFCNFVNAPIIELNLLLNDTLYKKFQQKRKLLIIYRE